jgi:hypothetical protein
MANPHRNVWGELGRQALSQDGTGWAKLTAARRRLRLFTPWFQEVGMTDAFEERKKKYEEKWAHDEAVRFKVGARRDKLLAQWAAGELGLSGAAAEAYAADLVKAELQGGAEGVFHKACTDLKATGHSEDAVRQKMSEFETLAAEQVLGKA